MFYTLDQIKSFSFAQSIHEIMKFTNMKWAFEKASVGVKCRVPSALEVQNHIVDMIKHIESSPNFNKVKTSVQRYNLGGFQISHKKYAKKGHVWDIHFSPVNIHISEK